MIDEFDHIIKKPEEFNKDFLDTLRTPGYHSYIAYITASLHSLRELCIKSMLKSTFYSIFYELKLGKFTLLMSLIFINEKEMVSFQNRRN